MVDELNFSAAQTSVDQRYVEASAAYVRCKSSDSRDGLLAFAKYYRQQSKADQAVFLDREAFWRLDTQLEELIRHATEHGLSATHADILIQIQEELQRAHRLTPGQIVIVKHTYTTYCGPWEG